MSEITRQFTTRNVIAFIRGALDDVQVPDEDAGIVLHMVYDPLNWQSAGAIQQHCGYHVKFTKDLYEPLTMSRFGGENGTPQTEGVKYPVTVTALRRRAGEPIDDWELTWGMADMIQQRLNHAFNVQQLIPAGVAFQWRGSSAPRTAIPNVEAVEVRFEFVGVVHLIPS